MVRRLIAIDPGARTGYALFEDAVLVRAGTVRGHELFTLPEADEAVVEMPTARRRHPRPDDILKLAALAGQCVARYRTCTTVSPQRWKGQLPKAVCQKRVFSRLTKKEITLASWGLVKLDHNAWDAIGIGLYFLGRF